MSEHHKLLKRQDQLSARRKMLSAEQRALLERRLRGGTAGAGAPGPLPPIEPVPRGGELPLSYFQEYDLKRLAARRESSAISKCFHVKGPFDREAFEQCLNALAARHEILRTTFPAVGGRHVQTIAPALDVKLPFATVAHLPAHERLPEALGLVSQCAFRPYDFAREPLWRSMLVGLGPNDHVLLLTTDHFISDAWSMDIFVRDAWVLYASFVTGARPNLAELPVQYADFSYWQRNVLSGPVLEGMTSYWLCKLDGMGLTPEVHFPNEVPLPPGAASDDSEVARFDIEIPEALTNSLRGLSQRKNTTMFIVTLSAFVALLHRYTGREDLGVCSPTANRNSPATKEVIGWFANT
ncbi:MAG TPA: condensation domain-containing protein, partial [Pyrinomonadaceae bacterium]